MFWNKGLILVKKGFWDVEINIVFEYEMIISFFYLEYVF